MVSHELRAPLIPIRTPTAGRYEFALARAPMTTSPNSSGPRGADTMLWDYTGLVLVDGRFVFALGGRGYGGEHWNSTILSHAFCLAVEDGANRTTGLRVEPVGDAPAPAMSSASTSAP